MFLALRQSSVLAIDLGNTNVVFGLFQGKKLVKVRRSQTLKFPIPNFQCPIDEVIICSVVPGLNKKLKEQINKLYKCKSFFVTAQNIPGLKVRLRNKREIGADRVVNALAVHELYGGPAIIVDFGTATTFDLVSAKGEYLGGAIAPGIDLARDALYERAAKLPKIKIKAPRGVVGRDTVSAMQSGLVYGYVAMVEGMVKRMNQALGSRRRARGIKVIATGGLAKLICKYTKVVDKIDNELTLKGLALIGDLPAGRQEN